MGRDGGRREEVEGMETIHGSWCMWDEPSRARWPEQPIGDLHYSTRHFGSPGNGHPTLGIPRGLCAAYHPFDLQVLASKFTEFRNVHVQGGIVVFSTPQRLQEGSIIIFFFAVSLIQFETLVLILSAVNSNIKYSPRFRSNIHSCNQCNAVNHRTTGTPQMMRISVLYFEATYSPLFMRCSDSRARRALRYSCKSKNSSTLELNSPTMQAARNSPEVSFRFRFPSDSTPRFEIYHCLPQNKRATRI
ncbi:hypothetical protein R3P38DRAFT_286876 [Favolaschia claudopus]|uniref:Uncharacterized protein n=1 Tax=Favolaschia claudopus TaxID=2862362 RepID=A0AAV9ZNT2_9AGAR